MNGLRNGGFFLALSAFLVLTFSVLHSTTAVCELVEAAKTETPKTDSAINSVSEFLSAYKVVLTLLIGCLTVLVAWLTYRVAALNRKGHLPHVNVEWKTPAAILVRYSKRNTTDMYYCIEGIFTNSGGRTVSAIELISGKDGFVYTLRATVGEQIKESAYPHLPEFFILSQPFQTYLSDPLKIDGEKKLSLREQVPLDIPIDPGKSHRFTMCFAFRNWEEQERKEENDIMIAFLVRFNNGQTAGLNTVVGGGGTLSKIKRQILSLEERG